ncbi:DarT ssDNA thymidine ADP-ribosyltransferase family protein [Massilia sp. erpn]|uniref:DarT ssDNA thymidine ADP-ribosyltransferase family protein n=1 Tax=Massilia sp. erpn TaxID=2738142 RepID=UPI002106812E|nr:DarT ssDNA thymidine ADP-ribosyltransferase family protein [Massilia sp. erpn]UTY57006.1 DUF4433 domain-containing protein [Massilia sp. erpn]
MSIQEFTKERGIKFLFHFTQIENLPSILANGLLTRKQCAARRIVPLVNDAYRLDHEDALCLSIGFPNYKMFYQVRQSNPGKQWAVVVLRPSLLWEKRVAFCRQNAAKAAVANVAIGERMGLPAFKTLFDDFEDKVRAEMGLPVDYPTHPQAEVLVFDDIEPARIVGVAFDDSALKNQYAAKYPDFDFRYIPRLFKYRQDYAHWKANG